MQEAAVVETPAPEVVQPEDDLGALYDKLTSEETVDETPEAETPEAPEPVEAVEEPQTETPPSFLPREVRDSWGEMKPEAREALVESQQEMMRKLSEQGRLMSGIKPVQDSLVRAIREIPHLADMKPQDVADQVFELAKVSQQFAQDPVKALMGYIDKHNVREQMAQTLAGQPVQNGDTINRLNQHIAKLEQKISQFENPEYLQGQFQQFHTMTTLEDRIQNFAGSAEHWGAVEDHLPLFIQIEQSMHPDGSPADILKGAYEAAVSRLVPEASKAPETAQAVQSDPEKAKAALRAKSVNVRSQPTGKARTLSERDELAAVYDRMQQ